MKKIGLLTTLLISGLLLAGCNKSVIENHEITENSEQASSIQQQCENQFTSEVISTNYEYKWNEENYFKENSIYWIVTIDTWKIPVFCELTTWWIAKIRIETLWAVVNKEYARLCVDFLENEYWIEWWAWTILYDNITSKWYHQFWEIESRFWEVLKYYNCYINSDSEINVEFIDAKDYTWGKFDDYLWIKVNYNITDEMNSYEIQNEWVKRIISYPHQNNDWAHWYINEIRGAMPKFKEISCAWAEQTQKDKQYCKLIQWPGEPFNECLEFIVDFEIIDENGVKKEFNDYKIMLWRVNDGNLFLLASWF